MLSAAHTLISLPFTIFLTNPVIIFLAAAVWHIFCDTLLHWNIYPKQFHRYPLALVALDISAGLTIAWGLTGANFSSLPVLAAIAGGNLPDVLHGLWDILAPTQRKSWPRYIRWCFAFHERTQLETNNVATGLVFQATLTVLSLYLVSSLQF
jgi:hypothetical protein